MKIPYGNSLSEVLIALFFSSLITSMLVQTYASIKTHYQWQARQLEAAQSAFLLTGWLKDKIHAAGDFGCNHQSKLLIENVAQRPYLAKAIWVLPSSSSFLPKAVQRSAVKDSSVLFLIQLVPPWDPILFSQIYSEVIGVALPTSVEPEDEIVLSDCQHAVVSTVKALSKSKKHISLSSTLTTSYQQSAVMALLEKNIIYLRKIKKGSALYVSDGKRSEALDEDAIGFNVTKHSAKGYSIVHAQIVRQNFSDIDFYVSVIGE